jgi:hypothetical protein
MSILLRFFVVLAVSATMAACSADITGPRQNPTSPLSLNATFPAVVGDTHAIQTSWIINYAEGFPPDLITARYVQNWVIFYCHKAGTGTLVFAGRTNTVPDTTYVIGVDVECRHEQGWGASGKFQEPPVRSTDVAFCATSRGCCISPFSDESVWWDKIFANSGKCGMDSMSASRWPTSGRRAHLTFPIRSESDAP